MTRQENALAMDRKSQSRQVWWAVNFGIFTFVVLLSLLVNANGCLPGLGYVPSCVLACLGFGAGITVDVAFIVLDGSRRYLALGVLAVYAVLGLPALLP